LTKIHVDNLIYLTPWKFTRSKIFISQVTILNQSSYPSYFFCSRLDSSKSSQYSPLIPAFHYSTFHSRKYSLFAVWIIRSFKGEKLIKIANLTYLTMKIYPSKIFNSQVTILNQSNYPSYFFCSRLISSKSSQYSLLIPAFHYSSFRSRKYSSFFVWVIRSFNGEKMKIANLTYCI
jgi:hypothetical protein